MTRGRKEVEAVWKTEGQFGNWSVEEIEGKSIQRKKGEFKRSQGDAIGRGWKTESWKGLERRSSGWGEHSEGRNNISTLTCRPLIPG
jgi:hypothetical protein